MMAQNSKGFSAIFATKGQAVLYGTVNGCALVWDRKKGTIVYGLKHPDGKKKFPPLNKASNVSSDCRFNRGFKGILCMRLLCVLFIPYFA